MITADYLIAFIVFLCASVNRQSIFILCAFALNECAFYLTCSDFSFSILSAILYASLALVLKSIKSEIQFALTAYSILYWFNGLDYLLFPHKTYFYVIFPYIIKIIDIYVIYHLINKGLRNGRYNSSSASSFNQWLSGLQLR